MNQPMTFASLVDALCAKGEISADDVLQLRRIVFPDEIGRAHV